MRKSVEAIHDLAVQSGQGISMDTERHARFMQNELEQELNTFLARIPEEFRGEYESRYVAKYSEWLNAMSRTFSVLVTGGSKFNNRRHEKMNNRERAARERLNEWRDKVVKRLNREQRLVGWAEVERLQNKLEKLTELQDMMKAVNKIVRSSKLSEVEQYDELRSLGLSDRTAKECMAEPQYSFQRKGFAAYQLSNNLARIKDTEKAIERHTRMAQSKDKQYTFDGGTVDVCNTEERLRVVFDAIPDAVVRQRMKSNGFKWSPRNGAWQRQLTPNAMYALKHFLQLPNLVLE